MVGQMRDPVGTLLAGRYEVLRAVGEESLGQVWAARDHKTGGLVRVKVLLPELSADRVRFARFGREMTASFMVTHPNTVEVLDYGEDAGVHFLVLEYFAGRSLAQVLNEEGPIADPQRVAPIAAQIAYALGAAHQEGIVHRALAPENVILLDNAIDGDYVKIRDFGMAKLTQEAPDEAEESESGGELTATGLRVGDPRYMPPEYIATGDYHAAGDLYALGGVLFHMVSGRPPFLGSRSQLLTQHISATPPALSQLVRGTAPWLDELVSDLLAKAPERRPGVRKIVARMESGSGHVLTMPALLPLDSDGQVPVTATSPPQRLAWPILAAVVGVVVCAGAAGLVLVGAAALAVVYALSLPS